jgi:hypothetical protein
VVSWESWQLVTAINDEGDGQTLCEDTHKVMTAPILAVLRSKYFCGVSSAIS